MVKEFFQCLKILPLTPTTMPSCMSGQDYRDKKKDQILKMKYPSWLETAKESYGMRERERSNHFVSFGVHTLNYPSHENTFQ